MDDTRDRLVRKGDYVYGSFIRPEQVDGYINGINPGDRSDVLGRFCFSEASVDDAVDHARVAARIWGAVPLTDRAHGLRRFRQAIAKGRERLVSMITRETGKPIWESRSEVIETLKSLDVLIEKGVERIAPIELNDQPGRTERMPRGVVAMLTPYNQPALITATYSAAAILAGNSVIYKPSKFTPGVGQLIAELWDQCRMPRGVVNMVQGSGSGVGKKLITHPDIDGLVVTGSFATAMEVRRQVFDRPELPVVYESGGKGIAMVLDGADLERATYEVMTGAFMTTGQRHDTTARVIVEKSVLEPFLSRLVEQTRRLEIGYGFDGDVFMGPLISENARSRFRRYGRALEKKGHKAILEGQSLTRTSRRGFYVSPAIHEVDWMAGSAFLNEEPPGPTLLVYPVSSLDEAIALHNQAYYRLSTALFPSEDHDMEYISGRLRTGRLLVNRATTTRALTLPCVGLGRSGSGNEGGIGLIEEMTYPRAQMVEMRPFDPTYTLPGTHWGDERSDPLIELDPVADTGAELKH
ncbi:MAG: aldehyde dehydrogenase [Proteobacteria bacterium]|nr:aldehyde dehydrogenase [Pseudomonadota bacterium]MCP4917557.1 aldehyde dehydrogenase [Pseudomonadota bacterium]